MNVFEVVDPKMNEFQKFDGEVTVQGALDLCYAKYAGPISALGFDDEGSKSEGEGFIYIKITFYKVFIAELKQLLFDIGKDDLKARQPPRTYGIWTTLPSKWTNWRALLFKKSHHDRIECESQHPYVCQRPAAALESSESLAWKGCYSQSFMGDTLPTLKSNLMTIDLCSNACESSVFMGITVAECFCFESLLQATKLSTKLCGEHCKGNKAQLCGGQGAMTVHQLKNEVNNDVMVIFGGTETSYDYVDNDPLQDNTVLMSGGQECEDHGIPDLPEPLMGTGFVSINHSVIVMCGGKKSSTTAHKGCKFALIHIFHCLHFLWLLIFQ